MAKFVTFFEVSFVDAASAPRFASGERRLSQRRFSTEAAATAFAATVQDQAFTAPGVCSLVPARVRALRADARVAAKWQLSDAAVQS